MTDYLDCTIEEFLAARPDAIEALKKCGLGKFESPEVVASLGSILKLRSALNMAGADIDCFVEQLDAAGDPGFSESYANQKNLSMLGLLPCGMKMPFKRKFEEYVAGLDADVAMRCLVEGNVNHELSYYPYIDTLETIDELPDVIVSADINSFLHNRFFERFVKPGHFEAFDLECGNPDFAGTDYTDPHSAYTMLSANILVLVVNKRKLGELDVPRRWADLLDPIYENTVTMRGQENAFFCSGVLLPFYKDYGIEGIRKMARAVKHGSHPAEMVKEIERNSPDSTPFYIMPLFFAQRLKNPEIFEIVYPEEGAIISPVFMLVKKGKKAEAKVLADFITDREMSQFCADAGFPSVRSDVDNHLPDGCRLSWMGWDFLRGEDPLAMKKKIETVFFDAFRGTGESA